MTPELCFIALGSNVGDRADHLAFARRELAALPASELIAESAIDDTAPLGPSGQGRYLNQIVALATRLAPHQLLDALQAIEARAGRVRGERWGARTLDLDIVDWPGRAVRDDRLTIPHPALGERDFWRRELAELGASPVTAVVGSGP